MEKSNQGIFKKLLRTIYPIDHFRVTPGLNFRGSSHFSFCGCLLSLLMYVALLVYFIWQVVVMATEPISTTSIEYGKMSDVLNISSFQFCNANSFGVVVNPISYIGVYREDRTYLPLQTCEEEVEGYQCFCFASTTLPTTEYLFATLNQQLIREESSAAMLFGGTILYLLNFKSYDYKPKDLANPVNPIWFRLEMLDGQQTGATIYHFNKLVFEIEDSILLHSKKTYEGVSIAYVQDLYQEAGSPYKYFTFSFDGQVITTTRSYKKIGDVFASVVGFQSVFVLVVTILFSQYFNFKYYENLVNYMNRLERLEGHKKKSDLDLENGQQGPQAVKGDDNQEIRLSYFQFVKEKVFSIFRRKKSEAQYAENRMSRFDNLEKQSKEIEHELEVSNLLLGMRKLKEILTENKILMQRQSERINNIEEAPENKAKQ